MKNTLTLAAAFAFTGLCFQVNAQTAKPAAKTTTTETKSEEKMETSKEEKMESPKEEKMEHAKAGKTMKHGGATHHTKKMAHKGKM